MALINWDVSFSVNVAEIDQQHKKLVEMVNELHNAMMQGKGRLLLGKIVDGLISYTATHFKTEEKYFETYGYPETYIHKQEHAAFVRKVTEFREGFKKRKLTLTIEVMDFLSDWIENHIKGTDKKYSRFFNEKGLR
jgi:hemerythrin